VHDLGIECPSVIEWKHWKAGGEYRKVTTVKNVSQRHQRIKYGLPTMGVFRWALSPVPFLCFRPQQKRTLSCNPVHGFVREERCLFYECGQLHFRFGCSRLSGSYLRQYRHRIPPMHINRLNVQLSAPAALCTGGGQLSILIEVTLIALTFLFAAYLLFLNSRDELNGMACK
jgi:hypothetical protein